MIVVTGASGHVGANLVRALLHRGEKVRALVHRDRRALEGLNVEIAEGDILDPESLRRAFKNADVVYHAAAYISILMTEWPRLEKINVIGTRNVVEACLACGVRRLVHFSSIHALAQEPADRPIDENRPLAQSRRYPPYDRSKAAGEVEVQRGVRNGLDAVVLNPTGIIGPYDFLPSHSGEVLICLARGTLPALVGGGFDWVDVRDVIEGAFLAEKKAPAGARYILSGHWISVCDMASQVTQCFGARPPRFVSPIWLARIGAPFATLHAVRAGHRPLYTAVSLKALKSNPRISHQKATRELGYQPRAFCSTIKDTLEWFSDNGYL